jgi:hypothetical protein
VANKNSGLAKALPKTDPTCTLNISKRNPTELISTEVSEETPSNPYLPENFTAFFTDRHNW